MHIHTFFHVPFEGLGSISNWISERGHTLSTTRLYAGDPLPEPGDFDRLIVMGGPMNIYEHALYPWLIQEKECLRRTIGAGKSVVGICLGAQLIADVLGSRVYPGPDKEIGWFPITLSEDGRKSGVLSGLPREFTVFHWHGDTFDVPVGAVHLAMSAGCRNQAFLYDDRVLGLQFHLESTPESVQAITGCCGDEIVPGRFIQGAEEMVAAGPEHYPQINSAMETILDQLA